MKSSRCLLTSTVALAAGEHPLQYNYTFWYSRRTPSRPANTQSYEQNIRQIGTVASVEQFWKFYSHLVRPGDLTGHSDFHLFKEGIKPMWEDEANRSGGKWIIRLRKGLASRFWENIILAMLGEQFMVGEEICGVVVSIRFQEDILSIWNKTASDQVTTSRIRDTLRRVLNLPPNTIMEYKTHNDSLKDNSSFRNTKIACEGKADDEDEGEEDVKDGETEGWRDGGRRGGYMSSLRFEELVGDVEAPSKPPSPQSEQHPNPLRHSWTGSPRPLWAESSDITSRLYSSLHQSREVDR
ncbi:eukaryotic translation initiation factor 4E type 2-like [Aplochiton taeniatus]